MRREVRRWLQSLWALGKKDLETLESRVFESGGRASLTLPSEQGVLSSPSVTPRSSRPLCTAVSILNGHRSPLPPCKEVGHAEAGVGRTSSAEGNIRSLDPLPFVLRVSNPFVSKSLAKPPFEAPRGTIPLWPSPKTATIPTALPSPGQPGMPGRPGAL